MTSSPTNLDPGPAQPPATVRDRVRDAVQNAWAAAVEAGALPAVPSDQPPPAVEIARPTPSTATWRRTSR
jgi:hypothetical protein